MIQKLLNIVTVKENFGTLESYFDFCEQYLSLIAGDTLQAVIVSQNENHYRFYQYGKEGGYQVTRPINANLMYDTEAFGAARKIFFQTLPALGAGVDMDPAQRAVLNNAVYTVQQSVGAALDALPAGESNKARKLNGTLFENLIRFLLQSMGVEAQSGTVRVPVNVPGEEAFKMNYQHDLIVSVEGEVKAIGSIKTSSKDRIGKIFVDKFLYSRLPESSLPHIAIFLNDVQRKGTLPRFGVSSTFLPGHFKGYTLKLNPLDGVYYCDIRPAMRTEPILRDHIKTLDHLLCDDIWKFVARKESTPIEVREEEVPYN